MKADLAKKLKHIAAILPDKWEKGFEKIQMSGKDANLCYIGSKRPFQDDQIIEFDCPRFVKINHYRKLKEGVKRNGPKFIGQYVSRM